MFMQVSHFLVHIALFCDPLNVISFLKFYRFQKGFDRSNMLVQTPKDVYILKMVFAQPKRAKG